MAIQGLRNFTAALTEMSDAVWQLRDRRVDGWPLMSSPLPTMLICLTYVFVVKVLGPKLMQGRPPFRLQAFLVVYNAVQVVLSAYIFVQLLRGGWWRDYNLFCQPVDHSDSPKARLMMHAAYAYYLSKFTEFVDTFTFVARKKFDHVSLLHVVHHGLMPLSVWPGVRFLPGGHATFFALANTLVHVVMYVYYLLAALGPKYQKYIFWKQHLTTFQMIQFIAIMAHGFQLMFYSDCGFPHQFAYYIAAHAVLFFVLFAHFYAKSYLFPGKPKGSGGSKDEGAKLKADGDAIRRHANSSVVGNNGNVVIRRRGSGAKQLDDDNEGVTKKAVAQNTNSIGLQAELDATLKPEQIETGIEASQILAAVRSELKDFMAELRTSLEASVLNELRALRADFKELSVLLRAEVKEPSDESSKRVRTPMQSRMGQATHSERKLSKIDEGIVLDLSKSFEHIKTLASSTPISKPPTDAAVYRVDESFSRPQKALGSSLKTIREFEPDVSPFDSAEDSKSLKLGKSEDGPGIESPRSLGSSSCKRKPGRATMESNDERGGVGPSFSSLAFRAGGIDPDFRAVGLIFGNQADVTFNVSAASPFDATEDLKSFADVASANTVSNTFGRDPDFTFDRAGEQIFGDIANFPSGGDYVQTERDVNADKVEIFSRRAKGYRFNYESKEWKEIGIGYLSILERKSSDKFQVVLTRDQVYTVAINHWIDDRIVVKPMSATGVSYFASNFVNDILKSECLAVKFKKEEDMKEFENVVKSCQEKAKMKNNAKVQ